MPFNKDGIWQPSSKQEKFIQIPDTIKEAFYGGGAGSGKTELLLMLPIIRGFYKQRGFKQVFLRRTYPELRNEVVPRSKEIYPKFGGEFNKAEMTWTWPEYNSMIFLGHCEHESDVSQYDSMEINLFTPDELTSLTEYIYLYIGLTRVRTSNPELPSLIRTSGMPGGIGHGWVKRRFVDPWPDGGKVLVGRGGLKRIFVFATQADNPHIDPTYKHNLEALPEAEKQAKLYGSFDAYLGQVFEEFRDRPIPTEPENALHVIEPFDIPDWWPRLCVGDWGFQAYTCILWGAISPDKRLYIYREQVWRKVKIEGWAPYVKEFIALDKPRLVKFCRSARQNHGQEHTIEQQINDALGVQIELSVNSHGARIAGKQLLHEYLRFNPKYVPASNKKSYDNNYAEWLLRNRGIKEYDSYMKSFVPGEEEAIPKLQIFKGCDFLINAIKACVYAKPKDGSPAEDVAPFEGDDAYDAVRYMVDTADRFYDEAKDEYEYIKRREEIRAKLLADQDQHTYYMSMRNLEELRKGPQPVRRFHHR